MSYRKFKAHKIFTGHQFLDHTHVLITNHQGEVADIVPIADAGGEVETYPGILVPGFINCHCHLELSHMKGIIATQTGMTNFILNVVQQRHFSEEIVLEAMARAESEMLANGIVAVGDICNNALSFSQKQKAQLYYHNFIEASGFAPAIAEQRLNNARGIWQQFKSLDAGLSIVPHAPYSVSPGLFKAIIDSQPNALLSMHNQECIAEENLFYNKSGDFLRMYESMNIDAGYFHPTGLNSLQSVFNYFLPDQSILLVHNVTTSAGDVEFLRSTGKESQKINFCICLNANKYIGNGLPDISLLMESGYPLVLGTDSLASNHALNIIDEIVAILEHFPFVTLEETLRWATINGARALQIESRMGSFEKGKKPGIINLPAAAEHHPGKEIRRLL